MKNKVILSIETDNSKNTYMEFAELMREAGLSARYHLSLITDVPAFFALDVMEAAAERGLSSMLNLSVSMEDITSPSYDFDFIIETIQKFTNKILPSKKLLIIDPYFYADDKPTTLSTLRSLVLPLSESLEEICIIHDASHVKGADGVRKLIREVVAGVRLSEITSKKFHDRFWLSPDNKRGVIFGTSLNGIGKKISLVDRLRESDVKELLSLANEVGYEHGLPI